jgi:hypothetical protein
MRLHDVKVGKNRFCGPAALSAITGRPVDEIVLAFHATFPDKKVMGTHGWEVRQVLGLYGPTLQFLDTPKKPTLAKWLRDNTTLRTPGRLFLLAAGHHWVVVSGRRIVCGKVKTVMSIRAYPHRRARVTEAYEVRGTLDRGLPAPVRAYKERKVKKAAAGARESARRAKTRRLAEKHGIEIDPDEYTSTIWVYPPEGLYASEADDPYDDEHCAAYWEEVEERVQAYAAAAEARAVNCTETVRPGPTGA